MKEGVRTERARINSDQGYICKIFPVCSTSSKMQLRLFKEAAVPATSMEWQLGVFLQNRQTIDSKLKTAYRFVQH